MIVDRAACSFDCCAPFPNALSARAKGGGERGRQKEDEVAACPCLLACRQHIERQFIATIDVETFNTGNQADAGGTGTLL